MTDSPPLPLPSWPFSVAKHCLIAQRSVAFWQPWISQVSNITSALSRGPCRANPSDLSTKRALGSSGPPLARHRCRWHQTSSPTTSPSVCSSASCSPIGVLSRSVLPDIWGANEEKWQGPEPRCSKPTHTTGWAASVALGMDITVANWHAHLRQSAAMRAGSVQQAEKKESKHADVQTRAQRAHWRLSWGERMARNARLSTASPLEVTIHGLPAAFAQSFGLDVVPAA